MWSGLVVCVKAAVLDEVLSVIPYTLIFDGPVVSDLCEARQYVYLGYVIELTVAH